MIFSEEAKAVFDAKEFETPEKDALHEQGFWGTKGADNRLNVYFRAKGIAPFIVSATPNYEDENDRELTYSLRFYFKRITFAPLYKYIDEWGKKHVKDSIALTGYFVEWLDDGHIGDYNGALEITTTTYDDEISFEMKDQAAFMQFLSEISTAFRELAGNHSNKKEDSYDNYGYAAIMSYQEKDFADVAYPDLIDSILIPVLTVGLNEGLEKFRLDRDENEQKHVISLALDQKRKSLNFYSGDRCKGKAFFEYKLGAIVPKCISTIETDGLSYSNEVARWFEEALQNVQNIYKQIGPAIKIPEAGNPVFECFE